MPDLTDAELAEGLRLEPCSHESGVHIRNAHGQCQWCHRMFSDLERDASLRELAALAAKGTADFRKEDAIEKLLETWKQRAIDRRWNPTAVQILSECSKELEALAKEIEDAG